MGGIGWGREVDLNHHLCSGQIFTGPGGRVSLTAISGSCAAFARIETGLDWLLRGFGLGRPRRFEPAALVRVGLLTKSAVSYGALSERGALQAL